MQGEGTAGPGAAGSGDHGGAGHGQAHGGAASGAPAHGAGGYGPPGDVPRIEVRERGGKGRDGEPQFLDRRLFFQLLAFEVESGAGATGAVTALGQQMTSRSVGAVIYADVANPRGLALLTWAEDPAIFVREVRAAVLDLPVPLRPRPELTMMGRTYSQGHEDDLEHWLIKRPISVAMNAAWNWAVWYPLRRSGAFAKLDPREQAGVLREHAIIGRAYGQQDLAHDIRLACHGLDAADNEFVVGLVGKDLHPLSHVVQAMRRTRQTAEFIAQMGPFFVGHAIYRTPS
jgi:chlorite dismutase